MIKPYTATEFSDAAIRGKMRAWKQLLDQRYRVIDRLERNQKTKEEALDFCMRSARVGRQRIFSRIDKRLKAAGAVLWALRLDGRDPLALWAMLRPRFPVSIEAIDPAYTQNCVAVNYIVFGSLSDTLAGLAHGLWTLEVPDHALGRVMQRSSLPPDTIIMAAHQSLLRLPMRALTEPQFLLRSGPGAFVCDIQVNYDLSFPQAGKGPYIMARTWLSDDQIRGEQVLLGEDSGTGERLGDRWLVPIIFRRSEFEEDGITGRVSVSPRGVFD